MGRQNGIKNKILLLDTQGMVIQSVAVMGESAALPFFRTIRRVHRAVGGGCLTIVACWDRKATFKKKISDDYKSKRPKLDPDWIQLVGKELKLIQDLLHCAGAIQVWADGHEADDVIYTMVRRFKKKADAIYIYTRDKDLYQLVGDKVFIILPPEIIVDDDYIKRHTGVSAGQWLDYKTLVGCPGDTVKGVRGIGPKKAVKLLSDHGSVVKLFSKGNFSPYPGWLEDLELSRKLVKLYNVSSKLKGKVLPKPNWKRFSEVAVEGGVPNLGVGDRLSEIIEVFEPKP